MNTTVAVFKSAAAAARVLPAPTVQRLCRAATATIPSLSPDRRLIVERNLARSMGRTPSAAEADRGVKAVFRAYARYYTDTARLPGLSSQEVDRGSATRDSDTSKTASPEAAARFWCSRMSAVGSGPEVGWPRCPDTR